MNSQKSTNTQEIVKSSTLEIVGGKPLTGEIVVRGAKNSVSKILVSTLLTGNECTLHNVPDIEDVDVVLSMIVAMGGEVLEHQNGTVRVVNKNIHTVDPSELHVIAGKSRIPILFAGPLLHRLKEALVPELGGCDIGPRPVDFHLNALQRFGASVLPVHKGFHLKAEKLVGTKIKLPYPSVGATEQVLLSGVLSEGVTELSNAAIEPEIMDLISVLQKMGAIISVETDRVITIRGVAELRGFEHSIVPDRIEVASWACVAVATGGRIFVRGAKQKDMMTFLNKLRQVGGEFQVSRDGIEFWRAHELSSIALETDVHPGFTTDWQQPFTVLLTQARGASIVHETVYEDRFGYVDALNKMGANIQIYKDCLGGKQCRFGQQNHMHSAVITGPTTLKGADITVPNLRAGFSYVVAALAAEGTSTIRNIETIRRGYEHFIDKLRGIGADISLT